MIFPVETKSEKKKERQQKNVGWICRCRLSELLNSRPAFKQFYPSSELLNLKFAHNF